MKVIKASKFAALQISTDEQEFPHYRRYRSDVWENLMGESWEPVDSPSELERLESALWEFMETPGGRLALADWIKDPALDLERRRLTP